MENCSAPPIRFVPASQEQAKAAAPPPAREHVPQQHKGIELGKDMWVDHKTGEVWKKRNDDALGGWHSITAIQEYVASLPMGAVVGNFDIANEIPFESIQDYVNTLRNACLPTGSFVWPDDSMSYQTALTVAIHHCPPGHMVMLKNALPVPDKFLVDPHSAESAETPKG